MKKLIALMLAFLMLFLCACSENKNTDTETTTAEQLLTDNTAATTLADSIQNTVNEWGSDLLPEDFPSPPNGTHDVIIEKNQPNEKYESEWVIMQFTCPENEIYRFTNNLLKAGYIGGAKKIEAPAKYYKAGFNGAWQNGKNLITVSASQYNEKGELTVVIDITACKDNFPPVLTNIFPKFEGFSKNSGLYNEYDEGKNRLNNKFEGSLNAKSWTWDFGFERAFVGVSETEVEAYVEKLVNAEFAGQSATSVTDGCTVVSYDLIKETENSIYGVFIAYNQILKTLDILYTNDATIIIPQ